MARLKVFFSLFLGVFAVVLGRFPSGNSSVFPFPGNSSFLNVNEFYIPTVNSDDSACRNDSIRYLEELKTMRWWATFMYDSGGRPASGVLYGAAYEMGNFDECLEAIAPPQYGNFRGRYCMGKFTMLLTGSQKNNHVDGDYNISLWDRMAEYAEDRTKAARNELYLAYCVPSSCSYKDLNHSIQKYVDEENNSQMNYKINFEINSRNCQVQKKIQLRTADILYITFLLFSVLLVVLASIYDAMLQKGSTEMPQLQGRIQNAILCFSFPRNYTRLVGPSSNTDGFDCMAGMKVYSMVLIVALHRAMFILGDPMVNPKYVEEWYTRFETVLLLNGPILVETFFTISGFLATFMILVQLNRSKNGINLILFYVHRVVRMSPTYAVVLAFYCTLLLKIGSGPLWQEKVALEQDRCRASWWANLLYINNYVNTDQICMFQSWFMTCDMNFFLFTPVISWILWKKPRIGIFITLAILVASILTVFVIVYVNNFDAIYMLYIKVLKDPVSHDVFKALYIPGHMRASSYFVGILTGYLKFWMKQNGTKIPSKLVKIGWILSAPLMVVSLFTGYIFYIFEVSSLFSALYASLYHFLWSIAIAWMLIAISSGHGPWIENILTWRPLLILSRLTYCVYISHGIIQIYTAASVRSPQYITIFGMAYLTGGDLLLAYFLAFALSMLYEMPAVGLEKVLLYSHLADKSSGKVKVDEIESTEMK